MSGSSISEETEDSLLQETDTDLSEPKIRVKWSQEEDDKLKELVQKLGQRSWKTIASHMERHSDVQCQQRWCTVLDPELVKGAWTKEEDLQVIRLVEEYGLKQWSKIAKHLKGRLGKQCRERWHNHLDPSVKKSSWTPEEDLIIYKAHCILGNRWAEIAKLLPGRPDNAVKNHWNSSIKRKVDMGFYDGEIFCPDEREELLARVERDDQGAACVRIKTEDSVETPCCSRGAGTPVPASVKVSPCKAEPSSPKEGLSPKPDITGDASCSNWAMNSSGFLSPTGSSLKEVLDMVDGDIDGWCDLTAFDLPEDSPSTEHLRFRLQGCVLQELSKGSKGELIPISPRGVTPSSILNLQSKRCMALSPDASSCKSPNGTPVKILPFSPSQFLNMWTKQDSHDLENPSLTSTPVCSQKAIVTTPLQREKSPLTPKDASIFVTPNRKSYMCTTPVTPTPFRNALRKYGALQPLPQYPNLEDDINEVILQDTGLIVDPEAGSAPPEQGRKSVRPPMKRVRKSLALDVIDCPAKCANKRKSHKNETKLGMKRDPIVESLSSSFCSKQDNILDQGFLMGPSDTAPFPCSVPPIPLSEKWMEIACGRTEDQRIMTERAKHYFRSSKPNAPNRALILI